MKLIKTVIAACAMIGVATPLQAQSPSWIHPGHTGDDFQEIDICNRHDEPIYIAVGRGHLDPAISALDVLVLGWEKLEAGQCINSGLPLWADAQRTKLARHFIYGETKGLFGGAIKKTWEGSDWRGCMMRDRTQLWTTSNYTAGQGLIMRNDCKGRDRFRAGMTEINDARNSKGNIYFNFGGR